MVTHQLTLVPKDLSKHEDLAEAAVLRSWRENPTSPAVLSQNPKEEKRELCTLLIQA